MIPFFNKFVTKICSPHPHNVLDPQRRKLLLSHNILTFYVLLITLIFRTAVMLFFNFTPSFDFVQFCMMTNFFVLFLLLCRSFYRLMHICITVASFIWCYYGLVTYPDFVIFYLCLAIATPPFIYFISKSIPIMLLSATLQAVVLHITFRKKLFIYLLSNDPEEFVHRFTDYGIVVLFFNIGGYSYLLKALNSKNIEISTAVKLAEDALEQQKTFIFSFSHELRNPINSLLGNLQLALMNNISQEVREMINTSKICAELLLNLINTMLDAGKLDLGKLEVNPVPTRIHDLLQRIWIISNDILSKKDITSHLKIEKKVPPVLLLDGHRIHQVLMNLIGNAIKFTQKGSINITIKWLATKQVNEKCFEPIPYDDQDEGVFEKEENMHFVKMGNQGKESKDCFILTGNAKEFNLNDLVEPQEENVQGVLKIIVKDTGCGINKEELQKLFQKFSQVGQDSFNPLRTESLNFDVRDQNQDPIVLPSKLIRESKCIFGAQGVKKQLGSGLGLFISQELCRNMNGEIRVYSRANKGSSFIVCIPTSAIRSSQRFGLTIQNETIQKQLTERKLKTIVADDSILNVSLVSNFFAKIGAQVVDTANNGKAAYESYVEMIESGGEVDIVTLDIDMPIMDGKTAYQKIREYERLNNKKPTLIILISGNYDEQQLNTFLDHHDQTNKADCFLRKPLLFEEFRWTIYKHIFQFH